MTKKIKITSLEKTTEYIDREWGQILAQRQYLLSTSDWTQLEDNELTFEARVRWNHWRNQVRDVRRRSVASIQEAEEKLKHLENNLPEREFILSRTARQKKYHLDLNNLDQAKYDAAFILKSLHYDWTIILIPESLDLINQKMEEVNRYFAANPKPKSLAEYPLLDISRKLYGWTRSEIMEHVMTLKRTATEIMVMIEQHRFKFTKQLQEAKTIDEVIGIVKNMHGY